MKARGHRDLLTVTSHAASITAGESLTASGTWHNDRAHGLQFRAKFPKTSAPSTLDGIEKYVSPGMILRHHPGHWPGLLQALIQAFREDTPRNAVESSAERLLTDL